MNKLESFEIEVIDDTENICKKTINIKYNFSHKKDLVKITKANLVLTNILGGEAGFNFEAGDIRWNNIERVVGQNNNVDIMTINLIDEIQTVTNNRLDEFNIVIESFSSENLFSFEDVTLDVEYIPKDYYENSFNVFSSNRHNITINPLNKLLGIKHLDLNVNSNVLPFDIKHVYNEKCYNSKIHSLIKDIELDTINCGTNFGLNIQQFLVKEKNNDNILYIDENLNEKELDIHYYYKNDNDKVYISKEQVESDIDGRLHFNEKEVYIESSDTNDIKLASDLSTYSNKRSYTLPEEYVNILDKYKQYIQALENAEKSINNTKKQLLNIALQKYLYDGNFDGTTISSSNEVNYQITYTHDDVSASDIRKAIKRTLQPYFDYDENKKYDSKKYSSVNTFSDKMEDYLIEFNFDDLKSSYNYEIYSIASLHQNIINTINTIDDYTSQKIEIESTIRDLEIQLESYKKQIPLYYLMIDDKILGFAPCEGCLDNNDFEVYRLVLIMDNYDNKVIINYESLSSPRISSIITAEEKTILFEYKDNYLKSITSEDEKKIEFVYSGHSENENLVKIIYFNDKASSYFYNFNNKIEYVVDENGLGVKIEYGSDDTITTHLLSIVSKIENDVMEVLPYNHLNLFNYIINDSKTKYNLYDYKCVIVEKGISPNTKNYTYCYNELGELVLEYENNDNVSIKSYKNDNGCKEITFEAEPNSEDYLANAVIESVSVNESQFYLGDNIFCGDDIYLTSTVNRQNETITLPSVNSSENKKSIYLNYQQNADILYKINNATYKYFILYGWAKADSAFVLPDPGENDRKFEYCVKVTGISKLTRAEEDVEYKTSFDWMNTDWQLGAVGIDVSPFSFVKALEITFDYSYNTGSAQITIPKLKIGEFTRNEYYENGLLKNTENSSKWKTEYEYDGNRNCIKKIVINKQAVDCEQVEYITKYLYNKENLLIKSFNWDGIVEENVYNEQGQVIETRKYHKDDPSTIISSCQKFDDKGKEFETLNDFGDVDQKLVYNHDERLETIIDADGNKVAMGYDFNDGNQVSLTSSVDGIQNKNTIKYTNGVATKLIHNDFDISYDYDGRLRKTKIKIADNDYLNYEYVDNYTTKSKYKDANNNEHCITTQVNEDGNVLSVNYDTNTSLKSNTYNADGNLLSSVDGLSNETTEYEYDELGKVLSKKVKNTSNSNEKLKIENSYDDSGNIANSKITNGASIQEYTYQYSKDLNNRLKSISFAHIVQNENVDVFSQNMSYDLLGRTKQTKTIIGEKIFTKQYSYLTKGNKTSQYIAAEWFGLQGENKAAIHYTYDSKGNITKIKHGGQFVVAYEYDALSRLIRENNKRLNFTKTYEYDAGGNVLEERTYYFTIQSLDDEAPTQVKKYKYRTEGWRDQLLGYSIKAIDYQNDISTTVNYEIGEYDSLGNPHRYNGHDMDWVRGRCLSSYNGNAYTYNADGVRTSKTHNNITTTFVLNGSKILSQSDGANTLHFQYGANGIEGFTLNGTQYIYQKNILGDIIGIFDSNQQLVAKYVYDAWGNQRIFAKINNEFIDITQESTYNTNIANINPFRYRGYYFDTETGFYYLNSRYYDPALGRFINADDISYADAEMLNGLNLYAYCGNNPITNTDENGSAWWDWLWKIAAAIAIVAIIGTIAAFTGGTAGVILGATFYGAVTGGISSAIIGGVIGGITNGWSGVLDGIANGLLSGVIIGGVTGAISAGVNIATGAVKIVGSAQKTGTFFHRLASNIQAGKMAIQIGRYSQITLDRSLNKAGLIGRKMPDVIGTARWGKNLLVEVTSKSQTYAQMATKLASMIANNPNSTYKIISWAAWISKLFM